MAKVIRHVDDDQKEFIKVIDMIANRFQRWEVWRDFIIMFAASLSNAVDKAHFEKREALYMQTIKKYRKSEQELFPQLCAIVVEALDRDKDRDYLGEMYMALDLGNHWHGQFFTPYDVCRMMAEMNCGNTVDEIKEKGYISVNDPTCGAGALLVAYANAAERATKDSEYNWQNHILFVAQDVDMVVGLMCYIQLSLIGCAGYVKIGNTLTEPATDGEAIRELLNPDSNYWYTVMYFSDVWQYRKMFQMLDLITRPSEQVKNDAENSDNADDTSAEQVTSKLEEQKKTDISVDNSQSVAASCEFIEEKNGQLSLF